MSSDKKNRGNSVEPKVVMLVETSNYLNRLEANQFSIFTQKFHLSAIKTLKEFDGKILSKDNSSYLVSFDSVGDAILCALEFRFKFKYVTPKFDANIRRLNIALDISKSKSGQLSKATAASIKRMCEVVKDQIVVSSGVQKMVEHKDSGAVLDKELIRCLKPSEEEFLLKLINVMEANWNDPFLGVSELSNKLGLGNYQLYRKLKSITGRSTNIFIREFRLHKALELLHQHEGSISEIATMTGFNSPNYFSRVFRNKYGILPSKYAQQHGI